MFNEIQENANFNFFWVKEQIQSAIRLGNWNIKAISLSQMGDNYILCALSAIEDEINYRQKKPCKQSEYQMTIGEMRFSRNALEWELRIRNKNLSGLQCNAYVA